MIDIGQQDAWKEEQERLQPLRKEHPEWFQLPSSDIHQFDLIGMPRPDTTLPVGIVKYSPLDFIVEEISVDGHVVSADVLPGNTGGDGHFVHADAVKVGIATPDLVTRVAQALAIDSKRVGYAGIKDAFAITAQRVSIENVSVDQVKKAAIPNVLLQQVGQANTPMKIGQLTGNKFSLFIRTNGRIDETGWNARLADIERDGILNYYGIQRFGTPRTIAHLFGMALLRGETQEAVELNVTQSSVFELPYVSGVREQLKAHWGDWKTMLPLTESLPFTLRYERAMLRVLAQSKSADPFLEAIVSLGDTMKLNCMSYASWLTNMYITERERTGQPVPETIPLLLSEQRAGDQLYRPWLERHGTLDWRQHVKRYPFLKLGREATLKTRIRPKVHASKVLDEGVAISFDLPKGAYATTILNTLFQVLPEGQTPDWINTTAYDPKELLHTGSLAAIRTHFAKEISATLSERIEIDP